ARERTVSVPATRTATAITPMTAPVHLDIPVEPNRRARPDGRRGPCAGGPALCISVAHPGGISARPPQRPLAVRYGSEATGVTCPDRTDLWSGSRIGPGGRVIFDRAKGGAPWRQPKRQDSPITAGP